MSSRHASSPSVAAEGVATSSKASSNAPDEAAPPRPTAQPLPRSSSATKASFVTSSARFVTPGTDGRRPRVGNPGLMKERGRDGWNHHLQTSTAGRTSQGFPALKAQRGQSSQSRSPPSEDGGAVAIVELQLPEGGL